MYKQTVRISTLKKSALLLVADTLADPLDKQSKKYKKLTAIRGKAKTDEIILAIAKLQYKCSIYFDELVGIHMPSINIKKCLEEGAKLSRDGDKVRKGVMMDQDKVSLDYGLAELTHGAGKGLKASHTPDELWETEGFLDKRAVVVSRARVMCYRPKFPVWSLTFDVNYDADIIEAEGIESYFTAAGKYVGLGGFRPAKNGMFGRFEVELIGKPVDMGND